VPPRPLRPVRDRPPALQFAETVRTVSGLARRRGLRVPAFVSPPRSPALDRSIRRRPDGSATVAIRLTGRPFAAVQSDVIDGVLAANHAVDRRVADRFRRAAWAALDGGGPTARQAVPPGGDGGPGVGLVA
jgi:hypothetical protein